MNLVKIKETMIDFMLRMDVAEKSSDEMRIWDKLSFLAENGCNKVATTEAVERIYDFLPIFGLIPKEVFAL